MIFPIVTEQRPTLEPVERDPFIASLARPAAAPNAPAN
jgi:hypothetical protein